MRQASPPPSLEENVPLAGLTTLEVGGPARYRAVCRSPAELAAALSWARQERRPVFALGGGSNLLVSGAGFPGLVVELADEELEIRREGATAWVLAGAGLSWDALVARTVAEGLGGIECLSGIPGRVGAAPIQNIGAYGQELAQTLEAVAAVEVATGERRRFAASELGLAYRWSRFKGPWKDRWIVSGVELRLSAGGRGTVRYRDLLERLGGAGRGAPTVAGVRREVLAVRREKSMVLVPGDPNRRSAGSFFLNPVVSAEVAERVRRQAAAESPEGGEPPFYPAPDGRVKLSAAWLLERAGFGRGFRLGRAGLSSRHALAVVNRGGATAAEIVALAATVRRGVAERFGVTLTPEPVFLGFDRPAEQVLGEALEGAAR